MRLCAVTDCDPGREMLLFSEGHKYGDPASAFPAFTGEEHGNDSMDCYARVFVVALLRCCRFTDETGVVSERSPWQAGRSGGR